jgi:hypothetical protein
VTRGVDDLLADLADAADAAAELVRLPDEVIKATPEIPWREVKGMRIIAAHAHTIESTVKRPGSVCATTSREWIRRSSTGARPKLDRARCVPSLLNPWAATSKTPLAQVSPKREDHSQLESSIQHRQ